MIRIDKEYEGKYYGKYNAGGNQHDLFAILLTELDDQGEEAKCHTDSRNHYKEGILFWYIKKHSNVIKHSGLEECHRNIAEQIACKEYKEALIFEDSHSRADE